MLLVDWIGASVTPRGFSVTGETLERTQVNEAAHQTPPGKDAGGTEINLSPCKVPFSTFDIIFFNNKKKSSEMIHWISSFIIKLNRHLLTQ